MWVTFFNSFMFQLIPQARVRANILYEADAGCELREICMTITSLLLPFWDTCSDILKSWLSISNAKTPTQTEVIESAIPPLPEGFVEQVQLMQNHVARLEITLNNIYMPSLIKQKRIIFESFLNQLLSRVSACKTSSQLNLAAGSFEHSLVSIAEHVWKELETILRSPGFEMDMLAASPLIQRLLSLCHNLKQLQEALADPARLASNLETVSKVDSMDLANAIFMLVPSLKLEGIMRVVNLATENMLSLVMTLKALVQCVCRAIEICVSGGLTEVDEGTPQHAETGAGTQLSQRINIWDI